MVWAMPRNEGGNEGRAHRSAGVDHALGDEEGQRVGVGHDAIVGLGILLEDLAADALEEGDDAALGLGVSGVGADDGAERPLAAGEAGGAEERVGRHPGCALPKTSAMARAGTVLTLPTSITICPGRGAGG